MAAVAAVAVEEVGVAADKVAAEGEGEGEEEEGRANYCT